MPWEYLNTRPHLALPGRRCIGDRDLFSCNTHLLHTEQLWSWPGRGACVENRLCAVRVWSDQVLCLQSGGAMRVSDSSSATLTSCIISDSKAGKVRRRAMQQDCVQMCGGSEGRRLHRDQGFFFCNTDLMHPEQQHCWQGKEFMNWRQLTW